MGVRKDASLQAAHALFTQHKTLLPLIFTPILGFRFEEEPRSFTSQEVF